MTQSLIFYALIGVLCRIITRDEATWISVVVAAMAVGVIQIGYAAL